MLPARFPNLLVNGAGGIAVGMATNIPPHNLGEVIAACNAYIDNPGISVEELIEHHSGPRFPDRRPDPRPGRRTQRLPERPRLDHHAIERHEIEEGRGDRRSIVLTSIPYQVGKNGLVEKIAEAAKDKRIEGVADIRDESNREGVRVVIDLKRDATPTSSSTSCGGTRPAQSSFPANMLAIRGGRPETLNLRTSSRSLRPLPRGGDHPPLQVRARQGPRSAPICCSASSSPSPISTRWCGSSAAPPRRPRPAPACSRANGRSPRSRPTSPSSRRSSMRSDGDSYRLSDAQVRAILELRLHRLTALGRDEIAGELGAARRLDRRAARDPRRPASSSTR